ncbi:MAG: hypothetical protein WA584_17640 [Pyrinomonadaceae bacterium]
MEEKDIVKFREPMNDDEKDALMVVIEMRDTRVLISDLRFSDWDIPPTNVYSVNDLEVVSQGNIAGI